MGVSILVQTLNEEVNLPRCLRSVGFSDDIVVLDSFSTDGTEKVAREFGARWVQRKFTGRAEHQNWAVTNIPWKHPWIYYTDADEVVPPELAQEIRAAAAEPHNPHAAYRVRRRDHFMGKWIRRSSQYPIWFVRMFRPEKIRWARKANPVPQIDGSVGTLTHDYLHYPFSKGLEDWLARHNRYSTYEAEESLRSLASRDFLVRELFAADASRQRQALKKLSFRLPCRPTLRFLFMFLVKRAFLDGWPGLVYSRLIANYEYQIVLKMRELRSRQQGLPL